MTDVRTYKEEVEAHFKQISRYLLREVEGKDKVLAVRVHQAISRSSVV